VAGLQTGSFFFSFVGPPPEVGPLSARRTMQTLLYLRLIGFTAGTLLMLFWMVVILGYRRQRNFERVFFFLCLALFLFYGGSLLALNAQIYYAQPPPLLTTFAWTILCAGLCFAPALLVHLHFEYASTRGLIFIARGHQNQWKRVTLTFVYAAVLLFAIRSYATLVAGQSFDFLQPASSLGRLFGIFLGAFFLGSAGWQFRFAAATAQQEEKHFHLFAGFGLSLSVLLVIFLHIVSLHLTPLIAGVATSLLEFLPIPLFAVLIYAVQKYKFLQIGRQTNLMYAISVTFLALLYLGLVRRASALLEPILPPEATASILLFVLVVFVEPIQRLLGRRLHETAQLQMDEVRRLIFKIRENAREGDLRDFIQFVGDRVKQQFEFADAWLEVIEPFIETARDNSQQAGTEGFPVSQPGLLNAVLYVRPHGAMISGEIRAALELLCEQLPASIDLCRLIEEKLRLERELAERERMAALGQMAASISHNLKNPLGSIKTILQVQIESRDLPENFRNESQMVLEEVNRLSSKLNQLLQFSRPAILGQSVEARCDAAEVLREVTEVLRPEADRRGVSLDRPAISKPLLAAIGKEALNDILTNLLVNALDAISPRGQIRVTASQSDGFCILTVEDDGPGIPPDLQEKILRPFFTTKSQGTGLGLAIIARRVTEAKGHLDFQSPARDGRGTRFQVRLPVANNSS
jgi:signal transduction histidine kinase